jgi:hypothetical protein
MAQVNFTSPKVLFAKFWLHAILIIRQLALLLMTTVCFRDLDVQMRCPYVDTSCLNTK